MYTVWHVDKHKITFKMLRKWKLQIQKSLSRPSIIDARAHYWAAARRLRSTGLWWPKHVRVLRCEVVKALTDTLDGIVLSFIIVLVWRTRMKQIKFKESIHSQYLFIQNNKLISKIKYIHIQIYNFTKLNAFEILKDHLEFSFLTDKTFSLKFIIMNIWYCHVSLENFVF
jgi:hypothetical protein